MVDWCTKSTYSFCNLLVEIITSRYHFWLYNAMFRVRHAIFDFGRAQFTHSKAWGCDRGRISSPFSLFLTWAPQLHFTFNIITFWTIKKFWYFKETFYFFFFFSAFYYRSNTTTEIILSFFCHFKTDCFICRMIRDVFGLIMWIWSSHFTEFYG